MSDTDRWAQVKRLFHAARELSESHRSDFLAAQCNGDGALMSQVLSLIAAHRVAEARLEPPGPADSSIAYAERLTGRVIGPFTLRRVLGCGGMGAVFEADQESPRRKVALKICRGAAHVDEHWVRLFRREVQALAHLNHPYIASLHESGHTEDGSHYFAMQLVDGLPLNVYVERHALGIDARLNLFLDICDAISYAHQRGVIHRDLKPSNILVDAQGRPKILDFGLAKITDSDVAVTTLTHDARRIQGTLVYMSPEQADARSGAIDVRTDIYSLGVVLFELLTGELPYDIRSAPLPQAVRLICETQPRRLGSVSRALRGDLETILLKALEKRPEKRYQSASEFAQDIRRYLDDQPIIARPPSAIYQLQKLVGRNKVSSALVGVVSFLVLSFGIGMSALYGQSQGHLARAIDAESQAARRADRAEQLSNFFLDLLTNMTPEQADSFGFLVQNSIWRVTGAVPEALRELVSAKREEVLADLRAHGDSPGTANRLLSLGILAVAREDFAEAESLTREAVRIMRRFPEVFRIELSVAIHAWAAAVEGSGKPAAAAELFREACAMQRTLIGENSPLLQGWNLRLASALKMMGQFQEAEPLIRQSLQRMEQVYGPESYMSSWAHRLWAELQLKTGNVEAALENFRREILGLERSGLRNQGTTLARGGIAACLLIQDRPQEARAALEEDQFPAKAALHGGYYLRDLKASLTARSLFEYAREHTDSPDDRASATLGCHTVEVALNERTEKYASDLRDIIRDRAALGPHDARSREATWWWTWVVVQRGDNTEGKRLLDGLLNADPKWPGSDSILTGRVLMGLGFISWRENGPEAESLLRQALEIFQTNLGPKDLGVATIRTWLGGYLQKRGRHEEAGRLLLEAAPILESYYGRESIQHRRILRSLVNHFIASGDQTQATKWRLHFAEATRAFVERGKEAPASNSVEALQQQEDLSRARTDWVDSLIKLGRTDEALPFIRAQDDPARLLVQIGRMEYQSARLNKARQFFQEALDAARFPADRVAALLGLADVARQRGLQYAESESLARKALDLARREFGDADAQTGHAARVVASACIALGKTAEGVALLEEFLPYFRKVENPAGGLCHAADIWVAAVQPQNAEQLFREALDSARSPGDRSVALRGLSTIACQYLRQFDLAEQYARESLLLARQAFGERDVRTRNTASALAQACLRAGHSDEAEQVWKEQLCTDEAWLGRDSSQVAADQAGLALVALKSGNPAAGEPLFRSYLTHCASRKPADPLAVAGARGRLGECLVALGRTDEAAELLVAAYPVIESRYGADSLFAEEIRIAMNLLDPPQAP